MNAVRYANAIQAEGGQLIGDSGKREQGHKEECLLIAIKCGSDCRTLEQKIELLQNEIAKVSEVYSSDELRSLEIRLDNANKALEFFRKKGAGKSYTYPGK